MKGNINLVFGWKCKGNQECFGQKMLRSEIIMYTNYNESTRRFRNLRRIEDFWDQQGKVSHEKEVVEIVVALEQLNQGWLNNHKKKNNYFMLQVLLMMLLHMEGRKLNLKVGQV